MVNNLETSFLGRIKTLGNRKFYLASSSSFVLASSAKSSSDLKVLLASPDLLSEDIFSL